MESILYFWDWLWNYKLVGIFPTRRERISKRLELLINSTDDEIKKEQLRLDIENLSLRRDEMTMVRRERRRKQFDKKTEMINKRLNALKENNGNEKNIMRIEKLISLRNLQ